MGTAVTPDAEMVRLTLDLWHPNCWTTRVTDRTDAGLLGHGVYAESDEAAAGRFTAYGDSRTDVDRLVEEARASGLTSSVIEIQRRTTATTQRRVGPGNANQELFVEFDLANSIDEAFTSRGFIYDGPTRIRDGRETWTLVANHDRQEIRSLLDEIREQMDAKISVTRISSTEQPHEPPTPETERLSARQLEVFELARDHGYYEWPRGISACELADKLEITKTTLLEHLRKAEGKILSSVE